MESQSNRVIDISESGIVLRQHTALDKLCDWFAAKFMDHHELWEDWCEYSWTLAEEEMEILLDCYEYGYHLFPCSMGELSILCCLRVELTPGGPQFYPAFILEGVDAVVEKGLAQIRNRTYVIGVEVGYELRQVELSIVEMESIRAGSALSKSIVDAYEGNEYTYEFRFNMDSDGSLQVLIDDDAVGYDGGWTDAHIDVSFEAAE